MIGQSPTLLAILSLAAGMIATEASAEWTYTRWGMSPAQVAAASQGRTRPGAVPPGKDYEGMTGGAVGTYEGDGAKFNVYFYFKTDRLVKVALERLAGTPCASLQRELELRYGRPVSSRRESIVTVDEWRDTGGGDLIRYVLVGDLPCSITYESLREL